MPEPIQAVPTPARKDPVLATIAAVLTAVCDAGILLSALGHIAPLATLCVFFLLLAGVLGLIALFLRGKKSLALFATINGFAFLPIIAFLAIPNLRHMKLEANEVSAVQSLRSISMAEIQYESTYPANGYACELSELGGNPGSGAPSAQAAQLLPQDLAAGQHYGYTFTITNCTKDGKNAVTSYEATAVPLSVGKTGRNGFCLDMSGAIKKDPAGGTNCTVPVQ